MTSEYEEFEVRELEKGEVILYPIIRKEKRKTK